MDFDDIYYYERFIWWFLFAWIYAKSLFIRLHSVSDCSCALCHNIRYSSNLSCISIDPSICFWIKRRKKTTNFRTSTPVQNNGRRNGCKWYMPVLILISSMMVHNFTNFVMKHKMEKIFPTFTSFDWYWYTVLIQ